MIRGERPDATRNDYALTDGLFIKFYTSYTLETLNRVHEEQYDALLRRIPKIEQMTAIGRMERKL